MLLLCEGDVRFLRHKKTLKIRIILRQTKTLKIRMNHLGIHTTLTRYIILFVWKRANEDQNVHVLPDF